VAQRFTGTYTMKVDAKGRMSVPAAFRRVLEANDDASAGEDFSAMQVIVGPHLRNCLQVYHMAAYEDILDNAELLPRGTPERKRFEDLFVVSAIEMKIDKDGRLVMPARLREKMGLLEGELTFTGRVDHFEIRASETHEAVEADLNEWLDAQGEDFDPLTLLPPRTVGAP